MKHFIYLSLILLLTTLSFAFSKEIKSTEKGGDWFSKKTWVGGRIPVKNDDVIISGLVTSNKNIVCHDLTLSKTGNFILDTKAGTKSTIFGLFTLLGCVEIKENTSVDINGGISKQSECMQNNGILIISDNKPEK